MIHKTAIIDPSAHIDDDVEISPFRVNSMIGGLLTKSLVQVSLSADRTLISDDLSKLVKISNSVTINDLGENFICVIYNQSDTASSITLGVGVTCDNSTHLNISPRGTMSLIFIEDGLIVIDGNTEA